MFTMENAAMYECCRSAMRMLKCLGNAMKISEEYIESVGDVQ